MKRIFVSGLFGKRHSNTEQLLPPPPPFPGFEAFEKAAREKEVKALERSRVWQGPIEPPRASPPEAPLKAPILKFPRQNNTTKQVSKEVMAVGNRKKYNVPRPKVTTNQILEEAWGVEENNGMSRPLTGTEGVLVQTFPQSTGQPAQKKGFFSKLFSKKEMELLPEFMPLDDHGIAHDTGPIDDSVHDEITDAIGSLKADFPEPQTAPSFQTTGDDVEHIEEQIHKARLALMDFKFEDAKQLYFDIMKQYQSLSTEKKHRVYEDIKDLFYERKNAEKYAVS